MQKQEQGADYWKEQGNEAFKQKKWGLAIKHYTKGIQIDPNNHLLYSNRAAAWMKMSKDHKALEDAEACIKIEPKWPKGWFRKGCALRELLRDEEAITALHHAIVLAPKDAEIRAKYEEVKRRIREKEEAKRLGARTEQSGEKELTEVSGEEYDKYKEAIRSREPIAYNEQALLALAQELIASVKINILVGGTQSAVGHFLLGCKADNGEQKQGKVGLEHAFDSPNTHKEAVLFLRKYCQELGVHGGCIVVKKSSVGYPQSWKGQTWKYAKKDGYFVQLESKTVRKLWFLPIGNAVEADEELAVETYGLVPRLLQE